MLFVDDLRLFGGSVGRVIRQAFRLECAVSPGEASEAIQRRGPFAAAIIDVDLRDARDGFDVARELRDAQPDVSLLLISGGPEPDFARRAVAIGAAFVDSIDFYPKTLFAFGTTVLCRELVPDPMLRAVAEAFLLKQVDLTLVDSKILALACADVRHCDIERFMGMPKDTLKSRVRKILDRPGRKFSSLESLVMSLRQDVRDLKR